MGFKKNLNYFFAASLFLSLLIITTFPSPSFPHEIQPKAPSINGVVPAQFRELYLKNTNTFFLNKEDLSNSKKKRTKKKMTRRKKMKNRKTKPFSVMLPKGFVPPSGSSPCHNEYPNSVTYCDLSTTKP
jgi:hypothetical protein